MKKGLIIANMLFASSTVFVMDQQSVRIEESSDINQSAGMTQVSSMAEKCRKLFKTAQSLLKDNKEFSEDAKLFYSKLNFDDIWEEIERVFFSDSYLENAEQTSDVEEILSRLGQIFGNNSSEAENIQTLLSRPDLELSFRRVIKGIGSEGSLREKNIELAGKRGAKLFYKQVLGDSELGKDLYKRAVREIDSAKYIRGLDRKSFCDSYNSVTKGITCAYRDYDDLLLVLIHEIGHSLDWFYRIREMYGQFTAETVFYNRFAWSDLLSKGEYYPGEQQSENISLFFETLLRSSRFRGNLYSEDSSVHRFRLLGSYQDFIRRSIGSEIMVVYEKEQLGELVDKNDKDALVQKLQKHDFFQQYLEILLEPQEIFPMDTVRDDIIKEKKPLWDNLLYTLDSKGYQDLSQYFRDIDKGKRKILSWKPSSQGIDYFEFSKNSSEVKGSQAKSNRVIWEGSSKIAVSLPELEEIDWNEIKDIAHEKKWKFESIIDGLMDSMKNIKSDQKVEMLKDLDNYTEGKYNSFRLIKEKGYFDILKKKKPLPIEEVMEELTKSAEPLNLTEKSVEEFFEFLKTGKLVS